MTGKTSPDWLPTGWALQSKIQKTGRRVTQYVNLATGQKFFTKDDLIRYTKSESYQCLEQQLNQRQTKKPSAKSHMNIAVSENDRPEWLPKNWFVEFKTFKSGMRMGKLWKIYVDSSTGFRFYSKPQVFRYLKQVEQKISKLKQKKLASQSTSKTAVNENERPEWLPKNWLMEFKTRQGGATIGRRFKIYVDPSTGSKFFSKPQVLRFLNLVEQKNSKSEEKERAYSTRKAVTEKSTVDDLPEGRIEEVKIRSANKVKLDLTTVKENEHPEWLPKNWLMECKTRQGGATIGRKFKIYVDPSTGSKFFSKPQVLRFLNLVEQKNSKFKQMEQAYSTRKAVTEKSTVDDLPEGSIEEVKIRSANKVKLDPTAEKENEHPEWLPKTWFIEFKTHQSGAKIGKRYKIYVDPSTGSRFFSQPQVLRFLNRVGQKNRKSKQKKRAYSTRKAVTEKSTVDDLPEGWIKEVKIRRSAEKVKQDPYYTDPATGYVFRSKKDALRYIETGEISKRAFLPKENHCDDQNLINNEKSQLPAAKRQKVEHLGTSTMGQLCTAKHASADSTVKSHLGSVKKTVEPIENKDVLGNQLQILQTGKTCDTKSKVQPLVCSDPSPAFKNLTGAIPLQAAPSEGLVSAPASNVQQKKNRGKTRMDANKRSRKRERKSSSASVDKATRQLKFGCNNTKLPNQDSAAAVNPEINSVRHHEGAILGEQPQMSRTQKGSDSKLELQPLFSSDPCLEFAIKTLTGAIPLEDAINKGLTSTPVANIQLQKNPPETRIEHGTCRRALFKSTRSEKKDFSLPHRSSKRLAGHNTPELVANSGLQSAIPRFEFASKSVTGSIVEETFTLHNYFPQQVGSSGSQRDGNLPPPDNGLPNLFQRGFSSHIGAMAQPVVQHQVPVNPSFPSPGNLSLPTCSTVVTQQPYTKEKELPGNSKVKS
ncbi:Methyl-CpG DNA binding protein [Corchorus capsularis]|uniref:Methyl-CpG DNA binding protein n=1 Tax=Corchorus capsularis TaxID=210143 RepID=A0A1R3IA85_COCAP|nr:Methyl-CpG DNA binding protein [Corchorus capsularis]